MKKLYALLLRHFRTEHDWRLSALMLPLLAVGVYANYWHDLNDRFFDNVQIPQIARYAYNFAAYGLAYYMPVLLVVFLRAGASQVLRNWPFWLVSASAIALFSYYATMRWQFDWVNANFPAEVQYYLRKVLVNLMRGLFVAVPLFAYWWWVDRRRNKGFYGFYSQGVSLWPYFLILALMAPLVVAASFAPDFLAHYPRYQPREEAAFWNVPQWLLYAIFEICYGVDFVFTEFFFRGFLVLGMARFLGPNVLWPMASFYLVIHFGKPIGETISSVFGGYILGVFAYHTRSIYGGIIVHLGVAWLMELAAFLQKAYN